MIVRYFLLIDGLDGDSTDANHVGWFDLNSFDLDLSRATSAATGAGTGVATACRLRRRGAGRRARRRPSTSWQSMVLMVARAMPGMWAGSISTALSLI